MLWIPIAMSLAVVGGGLPESLVRLTAQARMDMTPSVEILVSGADKENLQGMIVKTITDQVTTLPTPVGPISFSRGLVKNIGRDIGN